MIKTDYVIGAGLEKHEHAIRILRLVRDLEDRLQENGLINEGEKEQIANAYYGFLGSLPKKVSEEMRHG